MHTTHYYKKGNFLMILQASGKILSHAYCSGLEALANYNCNCEKKKILSIHATNRRFSKALNMDVLGVVSSQFRYSITQDR